MSSETPSRANWFPWWTLRVGLILGIAVFAFLWLATPNKFQYEAKAWLRIKSQPPRVAYELKPDPFYVRTQIELIKSPLILRDVISRPHVELDGNLSEVDPIKELQEGLTVTNVGSSELYTISYIDPQKGAAAVIANAVLASYLEQQPEYVDKHTDDTIQLLEGEKSSKADDVQQLRERVKQILKQTRVLPVVVQIGNEELTIPKWEYDLMALHAELHDLESRWAVLKAEQVSELERADAEQDKARLKAIEEELEQLNKEKQAVDAKTVFKRNAHLKTGDRTLELDFAIQELKRAEETYAKVAKRIRILQTEMSAPERVERLRDASVETAERVFVAPVRRMALISIIAGCMPLLLVLFKRLFWIRRR